MKEINRQGTIYRQLPNGTLTCGPLDQSDMVGGTGELSRNEEQNPERLNRIKQFHHHPKVLDFGCGSGLLVEYLRDMGVEAIGFDKYCSQGSSRRFIYNEWSAFEKEMFDVVTMVEVIEHTSAPHDELDKIFEVLKPDGVLMIETSFTDWMNLETDPYINPAIGHSTIFSHAGLEEVMKEKGFEVYGHINDNVRLFQKRGKWEPKITLITMGQGNPVAFKRTLDSFRGIYDEIIFGDVLIFDSDRDIITRYCDEYPLEIVRFQFNHIFKHGFADTLNELACHASNDWILYMNIGELMDGEHDIKSQLSIQYNCYSFDHKKETHRWFRLYNKKEVRWNNLIHEEVGGCNNVELRICPFNIFRMADSEKDGCDVKKHEPQTFYAKVCNDVKEMTYWNQYLKLIEHPELRGTTNEHWMKHARADYSSYQMRMTKKGKRYQAFVECNLAMYLEDIYTNAEFEKERFESSELINFQGDQKLL